MPSPRTFRALQLTAAPQTGPPLVIAASARAAPACSTAPRARVAPRAQPRRMGATSALPPARALSISGFSLPFSASIFKKL